jgi:hypothetical protein
MIIIGKFIHYFLLYKKKIKYWLIYSFFKKKYYLCDRFTQPLAEKRVVCECYV